jgi:hypothetical protein
MGRPRELSMADVMVFQAFYLTDSFEVLHVFLSTSLET